jgi:CubicO group peptidase (beta-lactamase class C family)
MLDEVAEPRQVDRTPGMWWDRRPCARRRSSRGSPESRRRSCWLHLAVPLLLLPSSCGQHNEADIPASPVAGDPADSGLVFLLEDARRRHGLPAIAVVVVRSDTVLAAEAVGVRRLNAPDPIAPGDRFHIGSNTKAMTATLVATLVEQGRIAWTTRPIDVLPELRDSIHPAYRDVTLEQLLWHRAGVPAFTSGFAIAFLPDSLYERGNRSSAAWRRAFTLHVLRSKPRIPPGTGFLYSNGGYTVAAAMAEAVTQQPWESLLQQNVFGPIGMEGGYGWPAASDPAQPWGHWRRLFRGLRPHDPNGKYQLGALLAPAGDVHVSSGEYGKFLQEHLRGLRGHNGLLRAATVQRLHVPNGDYAMGWSSRPLAGTRASAHEGSAGTFHAIAVLHPERDLAVAVFTNAGFSKAAAANRELARVLLERFSAR